MIALELKDATCDHCGFKITIYDSEILSDTFELVCRHCADRHKRIRLAFAALRKEMGDGEEE